MAKRRVYTPERDRGWSNGKYWKPKHHNDAEDEIYDAYCDTCKAIKPHQWDECLMCQADTKPMKPEQARKADEDLCEFGRGIADI